MKQQKKGMAVILTFAMVVVGSNICPGSARAAENPRFFPEKVTVQTAEAKQSAVTVSTVFLSKKVRIPGKPSWKSVKASGKKRMVAKWKGSGDGYQAEYAQNRSFTKKRKTYSYSDPDKTHTFIIHVPAPQTTYYVRVRMYREDDSGQKYYGPWSNVKKCKVK